VIAAAWLISVILLGPGRKDVQPRPMALGATRLPGYLRLFNAERLSGQWIQEDLIATSGLVSISSR
jgi:hypothetical protein